MPSMSTHEHPPRGSQNQRARFAPSRYTTAWEKVKKHLTPPSHPSTTSESAVDSSFNHTDILYLESEHGRVSGPTLDLLNPLAGTNSKHKKQVRRRPKSSAANSTSRYGDDDDPNLNPSDPFGHTVVDNDFEQFVPPAARSESGSTNQGAETKDSGTGMFSRTSKAEDEDGEDEMAGRESRTDVGSIRRDRRHSWVKRTTVYEFMTGRFWPNFRHFFDSSFPEESKERAFQKEMWFMSKGGAIASATYFLIAWVLTVSLLPMPLSNLNWGLYVACAGFLTVPIVVYIIFDFPRRQPHIYQPWLMAATWIFADILVIEMKTCGFFSTNNQCGSRNFINLFGWAYGQPVLAIFTMKQGRAYAVVGAAQWLILMCGLLMTEDNYPTLFYRNIVMFAFFQAFIIGASFLRERSDRQMFALRQQLKIQYRATQSAQVLERRSADSKKRFVSYIFHEVRVPLNTALLAVQNLEGEDVFRGLEEDQAEMVHGLMGSLTMMEKVLNDVLSFNRMESGKFTQARKPFDFHKSIQLVALSHRMQAQMAGIELIVELDKDIDKIGGMFVGDEMRLRQVTSNLVSNSIKFTEQGSVRIVTKLLYPRFGPTPSTEIDDPLNIAAGNAQAQVKHVEDREKDNEKGEYLPEVDLEKGSVPLETRRQSRDSIREKENGEQRRREKAVVRVEIHDTGVGLKKQDVIDNRLFSPYVQTEIGRRQGGKGSGLGLALVRQIVKLSNGRLGVESQFGKGSMFWFELPYSIPTKRKDMVHHLGMSLLGSPKSTRGSPTMIHNPTIPALYIPTGTPSGPARHPTPILQNSPLSPLSQTPLSPPPPAVHVVDYQSPDSVPHRPHLTGSDYPPPPGAGVGLHRPTMPESDSEMLLLPEAHVGQRRVPMEEIITSTFPSTYTETSTPTPMSPETRANTNPFDSARPFPQRTSSDSGRTRFDSPPGNSATTGQSGSSAGAGIIPAQPAPAGVTGQAGPASPSVEGPLCTLVVDDDKLTRMLMSRMLTRLGHQVTTAENGKMALELLTDCFEGKAGVPKFDIVFLDNQMPLMSGVEVAHHVREMGQHIFIVGCTGNALREDQEEYIAAGADDILTKPIHQKAVLNMIGEARKRIAGETVWVRGGGEDRRGSA